MCRNLHRTFPGPLISSRDFPGRPFGTFADELFNVQKSRHSKKADALIELQIGRLHLSNTVCESIKTSAIKFYLNHVWNFSMSNNLPHGFLDVKGKIYSTETVPSSCTVMVISSLTYARNSSPRESTTGILTSSSQTSARMAPAAASESIGSENSIQAG